MGSAGSTLAGIGSFAANSGASSLIQQSVNVQANLSVGGAP
jgi:hypothetical protein